MANSESADGERWVRPRRRLEGGEKRYELGGGNGRERDSAREVRRMREERDRLRRQHVYSQNSIEFEDDLKFPCDASKLEEYKKS
jgi:hypothetical protein